MGVAIAVHLAMPLTAIGLMLEEQRWTLAAGAFTLFGANLVGITIAAAAVLIVTGFVPLPRLRTATTGVVAGLIGASLAVVAVAIPLGIAYNRAMNTTRTQAAVTRRIAETIGGGNSVVMLCRVKTTAARPRCRRSVVAAVLMDDVAVARGDLAF